MAAQDDMREAISDAVQKQLRQLLEGMGFRISFGDL